MALICDKTNLLMLTVAYLRKKKLSVSFLVNVHIIFIPYELQTIIKMKLLVLPLYFASYRIHLKEENIPQFNKGKIDDKHM